MRRTILALGLCVGFSGPAFAETVSGNELLSACEAQDDLAQTGFCVGYLIGTIEGLRLGTSLPFLATMQDAPLSDKIAAGETVFGACIPPEANYNQHKDIAVAYMKTHPETRHEAARGLILTALREAFPCQ